MKLNQVYNGGALTGHRTYIVAGIGILSAVGAYLTGEANILETLSSVFPLAAIYYLRKGLTDGK